MKTPIEEEIRKLEKAFPEQVLSVYDNYSDRDLMSWIRDILEEQAKLFMSCLPEDKDCVRGGFSGVDNGFNNCRSEFLSNAEKLGLINKKDV